MIPFPFQFANFGQNLLSSTVRVTDPYLDNVTLLMHMDGSDASTAFVDSSPLHNVATVGGNAQIDTAQYAYGSSSGFFDGTGDYVGFSNVVGHQLTTGNFTLEVSIRINATPPTLGTIISKTSTDTANSQSYWIDITNTRILRFLFSTNGGNSGVLSMNSPFALNLNQWYKIAIIRLSGTIYMFIDGTLATSMTAGTFYNTAGGIRIGSTGMTGYPYYFNGWIDEVRLTKDVARYLTSNTQPVPTAEFPNDSADPYISQVSLLLHANGANGSTTFTDSSPSPKTITPLGNAQISTTQSKFGGASISFDGTGDYLTIPAGADFNFGAGDFTIECFVYLNTTPNGYGIITEAFPGSGDVYFALAFCNGSPGSATGNRLFFGNYQNATWLGAVDPNPIAINTWHHVAGVRNGNIWALYLNGELVSSQVIAKTLGQQDNIQIGRRWDATAGAEFLNGYVDEVRITKGVARYVVDYGYIPSTTLFPDAAVDPYIGYVSMLLHANGASGSTTITDSSTVPKTVTATGNAQLSNVQSMFGGTSIYFDGTGDYLSIPHAADLAFSANNFTLETWFYPVTLTSNPVIWVHRPALAAQGILLAVNPDGTVLLLAGDSNTADLWNINQTSSLAAPLVTTGSFHHLALVRNNSNWTIYLNGQSIMSATASFTLDDSGGTILIGKSDVGAQNFIDGYIDDFRVTNGIARYTANFTVPTSALPDL